jgi:hypothetical protein
MHRLECLLNIDRESIDPRRPRLASLFVYKDKPSLGCHGN